jgi:hypothetical protein
MTCSRTNPYTLFNIPGKKNYTNLIQQHAKASKSCLKLQYFNYRLHIPTANQAFISSTRVPPSGCVMLYSTLNFTYIFSLRLHFTVSEQPVSITEIILSVTENTSGQNHNLVMLAVTTTARVSVTQSTQPTKK